MSPGAIKDRLAIVDIRAGAAVHALIRGPRARVAMSSFLGIGQDPRRKRRRGNNGAAATIFLSSGPSLTPPRE